MPISTQYEGSEHTAKSSNKDRVVSVTSFFHVFGFMLLLHVAAYSLTYQLKL